MFLQRGASAEATGLLPLLWLPGTSIPPTVAPVQYNNLRLPQADAEVGLEGLLSRSVYRDQYEQTVDAVAGMIIETATQTPLQPVANLDLEATRSASELATKADARSHTKGGISKTCFVFAARTGWDWVPYPQAAPPRGRSVGSLAQEITGQLGLRYEEIPYDNDLPRKCGGGHGTRLVRDARRLVLEQPISGAHLPAIDRSSALAPGT